MSDKEKNSIPPEARRRGGMDTLFSAAWFDEDGKGGTPAGADRASQAGGPSASRSSEVQAAPKTSRAGLIIGVAVALFLLVGGAMCAGVFGAGAAYYYFTVIAVSASVGG